MSFARYVTLCETKIAIRFIWSVEICFIFLDQINVIFMCPLYEAVILCDCIIKMDILQATDNDVLKQQIYFDFNAHE